MILNKDVFFIVIILLSILNAQNPMKAPKCLNPKTSNKIKYNDEINTYFIYKEFISPIDGDRCPMYPSCSLYAKNAVDKFGIFIGFILFSDRLTRCGNDLFFYKEIRINKKILYIDSIKMGNILNHENY